jgi:hypothetical protein
LKFLSVTSSGATQSNAATVDQIKLVRGGLVGQHLAAKFGLLEAVDRPLVSIVTFGELLVLADRNHWGAAKREKMLRVLDLFVVVDTHDWVVLECHTEAQRTSRGSRRVTRVEGERCADCGVCEGNRGAVGNDRSGFPAFESAGVECAL